MANDCIGKVDYILFPLSHSPEEVADSVSLWIQIPTPDKPGIFCRVLLLHGVSRYPTFVNSDPGSISLYQHLSRLAGRRICQEQGGERQAFREM